LYCGGLWLHHAFLQHYLDLESAKAILKIPKKNKQTGRFVPLIPEFPSLNFLLHAIPFDILIVDSKHFVPFPVASEQLWPPLISIIRFRVSQILLLHRRF
jgi:hypothetical protein